MKGNLIKRFGNIGAILILLIGTLAPVTFLGNSVKAEAIKGAQVIVEEYYDGNENGEIDLSGKDDIGFHWYVDNAPVTVYIKIIAKNGIITKRTYDQTYIDQNCEYTWVWCDGVMSDVFGEKNTVQLWYGKKLSGYSEVTFSLPKSVNDFPINFIVKNERSVRYSIFFEKLVGTSALFDLILHLPIVTRIIEKIGS